MRNILLLLFIGLLIISNGCATNLPAYYAPSILLEGKGNVTVERFKYIIDEHNLKPNQINTGAGFTPMYFNQNIDEYVADAVKKELKFIGYSLSSSTDKVIGGDIIEFTCDYVGFVNVDYIVKIKFSIKVNEGKQEILLYSKIHEGKDQTKKWDSSGTENALQKSLSKTIESFIKDAQNEKLL
jgi:hypothetical protein